MRTYKYTNKNTYLHAHTHTHTHANKGIFIDKYGFRAVIATCAAGALVVVHFVLGVYTHTYTHTHTP